MSYTVQEQLKPKGLAGISDDQIEQHWGLYKGYVTNFNGLVDDLAKAEVGGRTWQEYKRRAGFEFDGMALHEYYFGNMVAGQSLKEAGAFGSAVGEQFGSVDNWKANFTKTGAMRGIGWAILYHDPTADQLYNWWISDHELNHPAGLNPILVMDVWEHAYMVDHGAAGRPDYIKAFMANVNWEVAEQRLVASREGRIFKRF